MPTPDIEIYIAGATAPAVQDWLQARFPDSAALRPAGRKQWRTQVMAAQHAIPVLVIEDAAPGFTSVWFDSPHSPWPDDMACAREAFAHFGREIRATPGSWAEGDDPDLWWRIAPEGEGSFHWPE
jgi:hypothetical protein